MKILAIFRVLDSADPAQIEALLEHEEKFAWRAYLDDFLREHYESDFPAPAISILEAPSLEAARERLQELPLLAAGLITAEFYPLRPFRNWQILFADSAKISVEGATA